MSPRSPLRAAVAVAAAAAVFSSSSAVAATGDFAVAPGTSSRGGGETLGLDFRDGVLRVA